LFKARLQEGLGGRPLFGIVGALQEPFITLANAASGREWLRGGRPGLEGCQRSHKGLLGFRLDARIGTSLPLQSLADGKKFPWIEQRPDKRNRADTRWNPRFVVGLER